MRAWTADAIRAAAAAWAWVPADACRVLTDDYLLVCYPEHYRTFPVEVLRSCSDRPVSELIGEVGGHARSWGHTRVHWTVSGATRPASTEAELLGRGATLAETCQVLAYDMTDGLPALDEPPGAHSEIVGDEAGVRAAQLVYAEVWGDGAEPDEAEIDRALADVREELAEWSSFRVVAYIGGQPASYGGCTLADGVARLWGAGTRAAYRGRGAYRAVLARRLTVAREHGATLALVKGRVETSAPILRRAGFRSYGEERCYLLDVAGRDAGGQAGAGRAAQAGGQAGAGRAAQAGAEAGS